MARLKASKTKQDKDFSKTVSWTGEVIPNLGGAKFVKSPSDGLVMSRDINGARGIFLRALVDTPSLKECICY
jgi:putative transposase